MANTYLTRTPSSAGNRRTFTISAWVKRASTTPNISIFSAHSANSETGHFVFRMSSSDSFGWSQWGYDSYSTRLFRDFSAWYHVVLAVDTTQATASNRIKMYVNGVQETSFSTGPIYPSQNEELPVNNTNKQVVGANSYSNTANYWDGLISHFHLIDGTAYDATAFGEYDANGVWKIKTSPSVTYGTNGFFILKDGNSVTDQSGNGNNFTVGGGTLTKTEDNPSNVFATWNPLYKNNSTFSNGNTTSASGSSGEFNSASTLGMPTGKWYMEFKRVSGNYPIFGIVDDIALAEYSNGNMGLGKTGTTKSIALRLNDGKTRVNNVVSTQGGSISNGDIVGVAVDKTTNKIYFSNNGQWSNGSGAWDSTTFNASTGATDVSSILTGDTWFFACGTDTGEASNTFSANFGNGYFGTTAVASAGTNASGIGIFEYDVPTGYTALSTKGLNL